MFKLLEQEKTYLMELKQSVLPHAITEDERLDEYLDYVDFMSEADEIFEESDLLLQEIDLAKLKSDVLRFMGLKKTLMDRIKSAVGQGDTSAAEKLKNQLGNLNDKIEKTLLVMLLRVLEKLLRKVKTLQVMLLVKQKTLQVMLLVKQKTLQVMFLRVQENWVERLLKALENLQVKQKN